MEEFFDLYTHDGRALGKRKRREHVHRDGDWHRSIALWVVRPNGNLVWQQRSAEKDTHPGLLTATVSGHYASGEALEDVLREAKEEVGVPVREAALISLGRWRHDDRPVPGVIDRELQDVFLWPTGIALLAFHPDQREVTALVEMAPDTVLALLEGMREAIDAAWLDTGQQTIRQKALSATAFVPTALYHRGICMAAMDYAAGRAPRCLGATVPTERD